MKNYFSIFLILISVNLLAQTNQNKILFIGNSFTYFNNMPDIFKSIAEQSGKTIEMSVHAPGGMSVGDYSQGTNAHSLNPAVYDLIESKQWDYVIIQDNQGRFVLDSAVFPTSSSNVVGGHLMLRDSIRAVNSCAKIIWFAGWAYENGYPPYGNTGKEMIERILVNYRVLNETAKDVISPIGESWIQILNNLPGIQLWSSDGAHPSLSGSYLTALSIFSTIFQENPVPYDYNPGIDSLKADSMRQFTWQVMSDSNNFVKYNLGGINSANIWNAGNHLYTDTSVIYQWFNGITPIAGDTNRLFFPDSTGDYHVLIKDSIGCWLKSCEMNFVTSIFLKDKKNWNVYPNPVKSDENIKIITNEFDNQIVFELYDMYGRKKMQRILPNRDLNSVNLKNIKPGKYVYRLMSGHKNKRGKILIIP